MKKSNIIVLISILIVCIVVGVIFVEKNNKRTSSSQEITLPVSNLDSAAEIPSTNMLLPYPSQGFYGLGAQLSTGAEQGLAVSTKVPYDVNKGSEYVVLSASVVRLAKNGETLKDVVESFASLDSIERDYIKTNGKYETINGHEYFIYKVTEDVTVWSGVVVSNGNVVAITLAYKYTEAPESMAAYKNNDMLFREILSKISFK